MDDDSVVEVEVPVVDEALDPVGKTGRSQSMVWGYFTDVVQPQKLKAEVCKHCRHLINHHKKSESAINHLSKCSEFHHVMSVLEISERPDWFVSNKNRRPCGTTLLRPCRSLRHLMVSGPSTSFAYLRYRDPRRRRRRRSSRSISPRTTTPQGRLFSALRMFIFKKLFACCNPNKNIIPNRKKIAGELLNKCCYRLNANVDIRMKGAHLCLVTDGWSNIKKDPIINYIATSPTGCFFLESVSTGQKGHSAD